MAVTKNKSELEVKVLEVQQWLASLSSDLNNEPFEIDEFTVEYLYQLCQVFEYVYYLARINYIDFSILECFPLIEALSQSV